MKKLILTSACVLAATGMAFAQGEVEWNAITPTYFTADTNTTALSYLSTAGAPLPASKTVGLTVASAGAFYYELLYTASGTAAPTSLAALDTWSDSGLEAVNNAGSAGKTTTINGTVETQVPFTATSSVMLVGWSSNLGTTWAAASALLNNAASLAALEQVGTVLFGQSGVGTITPASNGTSPGAVLFGPSPEINSPLTQLDVVSTVPEPTTIALGAMGAASLLALRRKKA